jgi:hypothetical protein
MFGYPVTLYYQKEDRYKTVLGGVISLMLVVFFIVLYFGNIAAFLNKTEITSVSYTTFTPIPTLLNLDASNFMFALNFNQGESNIVDLPYFNVSVVQRIESYHVNGTKTVEDRPIPLESCRLSKF